ncbi:hypothetical protein ACLB2K_021818 [Fragaria x ananassa]
MERSSFGHALTSVASNPNLGDRFQMHHESTNTLIHPSDSEEATFDINYFNNPTLKSISDILLDGDLEGKNCMLQDSLALQAAEKTFYDALYPKDPPFSNQLPLPCQNSEYSQNDSIHSSLVESFSDTLTVSDSLFEMKSLGQAGEASKFRTNGNFDINDKERYQTNGLKGKKNHQREDEQHPEEGRSSKQSVVSADDSEPQEIFDKVLLCQGDHHEEWGSCTPHCSTKREGTEKLQQNRQSKGSKTNRSKQQNKDEEAVDLTTMLNQCAQAVASYDQGTASELLRKIKQHSSPDGHATQRLAHYFANGLEARLTGIRTPSFSPLFSRHTSAAEILLAFEVFASTCPFITISRFLANRTIMKLAKNETRLHIIDFGISYGFQWPCLIQHLSERPHGPPKLHITAIELPQPGFRPTERVEETMRLLARYCAKFNVPFEYKVMAQKWETIRCEDLKIYRNELVVVNCLHRLRHIHDETVMENSPRDAVLKLIKNINPNLFIHGVINGRHNTPFFATRFKEALLHYYTIFDIFEATIPREEKRRMVLERDIHGKDIMNIIACEGVERVERPETYKKWQTRNVRAGLKQLPLDQELMKKAKKFSKLMDYHNDFRIDEDGDWMLHGWKGRIFTALSFWKPA